MNFPDYIITSGPLHGLHKNIRVNNDSLYGRGLIAAEPIYEGECVYVDYNVNDNPVRIDEVNSYPEEIKRAILIWGYQTSNTELYTFKSYDEATNNAGCLMNHSCDPNTWFENDFVMTARRNINAGEELTCDYATLRTHEWKEQDHAKIWNFDCGCGSLICRGKVTVNDWKREDLRERYGHHFLAFILEMIKK